MAATLKIRLGKILLLVFAFLTLPHLKINIILILNIVQMEFNCPKSKKITMSDERSLFTAQLAGHI